MCVCVYVCLGVQVKSVRAYVSVRMCKTTGKTVSVYVTVCDRIRTTSFSTILVSCNFYSRFLKNYPIFFKSTLDFFID